MRILFTVNTYAPNTDGVQFVTKYLAEGLVEKGHDVTVITYMYPERCSISSETINGVNVIRWNARTEHTIHKGDKKGYQRFIIKHQNEYDVMINVGTQTALTDWLFDISDDITIPRLLYIHSIWDFKLYRHDFSSIKSLCNKLFANVRWWLYYNTMGREFKKYSVVTQLHEKDHCYEYFLKKYGIKSKIIENAAETDFFQAVTEPNKYGKYIINVSNFSERKNQARCIDLFMNEAFAGWKLVLIGSSENDYLRKLKEKVGMWSNERNSRSEDIIFLVGQDRKHIYNYVKNASIYLQTSTWEAFPISIIEAMAAGVPYISSDVGIVKYLGGGYIAKNNKEFLGYLKKLVQEPDTRRRLGNEGKIEAEQHYKVYDKVCQLETYLLEMKEGKL